MEEMINLCFFLAVVLPCGNKMERGWIEIYDLMLINRGSYEVCLSRAFCVPDVSVRDFTSH